MFLASGRGCALRSQRQRATHKRGVSGMRTVAGVSTNGDRRKHFDTGGVQRGADSRVWPVTHSHCWRAHERVHVRQCETWGPLFVPAYLTASLWAVWRGRNFYLITGSRWRRFKLARVDTGRNRQWRRKSLLA